MSSFMKTKYIYTYTKLTEIQSLLQSVLYQRHQGKQLALSGKADAVIHKVKVGLQTTCQNQWCTKKDIQSHEINSCYANIPLPMHTHTHTHTHPYTHTQSKLTECFHLCLLWYDGIFLCVWCTHAECFAHWLSVSHSQVAPCIWEHVIGGIFSHLSKFLHFC